MSSPSAAGPPRFDTTDPAFLADPYPTYKLLREHAPVLWAEPVQSWVISRYEDVAGLLRDPRLVQDQGNSTAFTILPAGAPRFDRLMKLFDGWMLFRNPPEHTRLRGLVQKAFTPRIVDGLKAPMRQLVEDYLDAAATKGKMDIIADLAFPLPVTVIALMLGVPQSDHERFKSWSNALAVTLEPVVSVDVMAAAEKAAGEITDYFRDLVGRKKAHPGEDLLTAMIHAEEAGNRLTMDDLLANAVLLLAAGHETTVNLIGNGMLALLRHPDQMAKLREHPALLKGAIEELLRYDAPAQMTARLFTKEMTLHGVTIPAGGRALLLIGAANRDPSEFLDPDRLDVTRTEVHHLSFGGGPHYCIGAPLARVEGQIAIGRLVDRFPKLRLATPQLRHRPLAVLRGVAELPVLV